MSRSVSFISRDVFLFQEIGRRTDIVGNSGIRKKCYKLCLVYWSFRLKKTKTVSSLKSDVTLFETITVRDN